VKFSNVLSLQIDRSSLQGIYSDTWLISELASIESRIPRFDARQELAVLVNTSTSRSQALSRWFRYREAYSPAIVESILNRHPIATDSFVFDPMCGSGSTQVGAQLLGFRSMGIDVNPYAVLMSEVKTARFRKKDLVEVKRLLDLLRTCGISRARLSAVDQRLSRYFPIDNLRALVKYRDEILKQPPSPASRLVFSAILGALEECSNRKKDGNGLATRPSKVESPFSSIERVVQQMILDLTQRAGQMPKSLSLQFSAIRSAEAIELGRRALSQDPGAIIFSPPYANSFDYFESYKLELLFGKFYDFETLKVAKKLLLRSYRQGAKGSSTFINPLLEKIISEIQARIPAKEAKTGVKDGRSRLLPHMLRGYFEDMSAVFSELRKQLSSGRKVHVVVDQSAYLGVLVPTDLLIANIAEPLGFQCREIAICRAARTSTQQSGSSSPVERVLRESVVTLEAQ